MLPGTDAVSARARAHLKRLREVQIDRAIYLADDEARAYRFLKRNPHWQALDPRINDANKRSIDGYVRMLSNGSHRMYRYRRQ